MLYILSALGNDLKEPDMIYGSGSFDDAVVQAKRMIEANPKLELVEIFSEGYFLGEVDLRFQAVKSEASPPGCAKGDQA